MRTLTVGVLLLVLTACGGSTGVRVAHDVPPASLTVVCAAPVHLPERVLTQAEAEAFWGRDRSALRRCGGQVAGLAAWVESEAQGGAVSRR